MAFTLSENRSQYWYTDPLEDESIRKCEGPLNYQSLMMDKNLYFEAFRHESLPTSGMDVITSHQNEYGYCQGLAPSLVHPFPMEHSLDGQYSPPEWIFDYEVMRTRRYMSPNGPHGGSLSESSASSESAYTTDVQPLPVRFSQSPADIPAQCPSKPFEYLPVDLTQWIPTSSNTCIGQNVPQSSYYPQLEPSLSPKELEFRPVEDLGYEQSFDEEVVHVHPEIPIQRRDPEAVDLTSVNEDSVTSSLSSINDSDIEPFEEEEEELSDNDSMAIEDNHSDSDPDYDIRPRRRTNSRNSTATTKGSARPQRSPRQTRVNSSPNRSGIIDEKARVRKSGPSSNASSSTSTHTQRASKSKARAKKPEFVKRLEQSAKQGATTKINRSFPCTFHHFGCKFEFPNKNEWKRHVAFQHLQLGYYRCDMGSCNPDNKTVLGSSERRRSSSDRTSKTRAPKEEDNVEIKTYNDFNRKDLFTQHCRRMHGPSRNPDLCSNPPNKRGTLSPTKEDHDTFEEMLHEIRQRCWNFRRPAPARSGCGFCTRLFDAEDYENRHGDDSKDDTCAEEKAWEARMEHIGKHYEKDTQALKDDEDIDEDLRDWGIGNGLLETLADGRAWLINVPASPIVKSEETMDASGQIVQDIRGRPLRKANRRPSKTIEYHSKVKSEEVQSPNCKIEPTDGEDDAEGDSDPAVK